MYSMLGYDAVKDCSICIWLYVNVWSVLGTVLTFTNDNSRYSVEYLFRWGCHKENYKANNSPTNALISSRCQNHLLTLDQMTSQSQWLQECACVVKTTFIFLSRMPWWDHISRSLYSQRYLLFTSHLFDNAGGEWVSSERSEHLNYTPAT